MPTVAAMALASTLAYLLEGSLASSLGIGLGALASLVVWGLTYHFTRRWLLLLRDGDPGD